MTFPDEPLGERLKRQYEIPARITLDPSQWWVIRVDGKAFHTFTRNLVKPYDAALGKHMQTTAVALASAVQGARLAYTQSDEISVIVAPCQGTAQPWLRGDQQKIVSVAAATASTRLTGERDSAYARDEIAEDDSAPIFDARAFTLPDADEVRRYLMWRQFDASRNAVQSIGRALLGHHALHGLTRVGVLAAIGQLGEHGVSLADYPPEFLEGVTVAREPREVAVAQEHGGGTVTRHYWRARPAIRFTELSPTLGGWLDLSNPAAPGEAATVGSDQTEDGS